MSYQLLQARWPLHQDVRFLNKNFFVEMFLYNTRAIRRKKCIFTLICAEMHLRSTLRSFSKVIKDPTKCGNIKNRHTHLSFPLT